MEKPKFSQHLLRTSDYRSLSDIERAVKLVKSGVLTGRAAARACNIPSTTLQRALVSTAQGRPLGIPGRPSFFNQAEKENFQQTILDRVDAGEQPSVSVAQEVVSFI